MAPRARSWTVSVRESARARRRVVPAARSRVTWSSSATGSASVRSTCITGSIVVQSPRTFSDLPLHRQALHRLSARRHDDVGDVALPQQFVERRQIRADELVEPTGVAPQPLLEQFLHLGLLARRLEVAAREAVGEVPDPRDQLRGVPNAVLGSREAQLVQVHLDVDELLIELVTGLLDRGIVDLPPEALDLTPHRLDFIHGADRGVHTT